MNILPCPSGCPEREPDIREVPPHIGAYCRACKRWLKWLPQTPELLAELYGVDGTAPLVQWRPL